jgi:hypothetical protein
MVVKVTAPDASVVWRPRRKVRALVLLYCE